MDAQDYRCAQTRELVVATAHAVTFLLRDWISEKEIAKRGMGSLAQKAMAEDLSNAEALLSELEELL